MGGGLKTKLTAHGRSFHPALGQAVEAYGMSRGPPPEGGWKYIARKDKTTMAEGSRRACEPCVRNQFTRLELLFHWGRLPRSGSRWKVRSPGASVSLVLFRCQLSHCPPRTHPLNQILVLSVPPHLLCQGLTLLPQGATKALSALII